MQYQDTDKLFTCNSMLLTRGTVLFEIYIFIFVYEVQSEGYENGKNVKACSLRENHKTYYDCRPPNG